MYIHIYIYICIYNVHVYDIRLGEGGSGKIRPRYRICIVWHWGVVLQVVTSCSIFDTSKVTLVCLPRWRAALPLIVNLRRWVLITILRLPWFTGIASPADHRLRFDMISSLVFSAKSRYEPSSFSSRVLIICLTSSSCGLELSLGALVVLVKFFSVSSHRTNLGECTVYFANVSSVPDGQAVRPGK